MVSVFNDNRDDTACDKCGAPPSVKGYLSTQVTVRKNSTDGTIEQKEIVDGSSEVLEETEKV